jgi:hypothetical protein
MIIENVRSLPKQKFATNYLLLFVEFLTFQKIGLSGGNASPLTNHLLTNLGSESNCHVVMVPYA